VKRLAAVAKVHHALADGVASAKILEDFMTPDPAGEMSGSEAWQPEEPPSGWRLGWWAFKDLVRDLVRIPGQIMAIRAAKKRQEARSLPPELRPPDTYSGPFTPLNRPISSHRKFCFFTVPLADVKEVGKTFGYTINDVVLNMAAEAIRAYLQRSGDLPQEPLTASVPVSTRGHEEVHTYGNKVGAICVSLGTHIEDPVERLQVIHQSMEAAKQDF
jgi:WS/DGAT/MGAT family acyltransferase